MNNSVESISNIKLSTIINRSEGGNDLFITGYDSLLANDDSRATRDFYLLLMVYVNYFCVPVLFVDLKDIYGFERSVQPQISKTSKFVCVATILLAEDKNKFSILPFSWKKQDEYNLRFLCSMTVLS